MGNKIRIKQIDLQGIFSASNQVDIISASNYAQFVTQLDTTMSSDSELTAVSSSISQSIYTINQVIGSGLVSGSSQLTSSYDTRYILSGSITQTTWDNISGKPAGLVSESTDLTSLNQFTSSIQTQVDGISAQTSSYLTSSGSVDYSDITNIPSGIVSQSTDLTHLNSFTSSYYTDSSSFDTRIGNEKGRIDAILSASSADKDSFAEIVSLINSVDLTNDNAFATFYTSSNSRISSLENSTGSYETKGSGILSGSVSYLDLINIPSGIVSQSTDLSSLNLFTESLDDRVSSLENATGSYLTSLSGAISSSSQLTSSFDTRYTLSGSVQPLPSGLISGSSQLTSSFDTRYTLSGSVQPLPSNLVSSSAQITAFGFISSSQTINTGSFLTTSSYQTDSASFDTRINSITLSSGSNLTYFIEAYANVTYTLPGTFTEDPCRYSIVSVNENVPSSWFDTSTYTFTPQKAGYWEIVASYDVYRNAEASMIIKKNGSIVASAGSFNAVAQEISKIIYLNGSTDYINIVNVGGAALQRAQFQSRSWFQAKFVGNISGSTELPSGLVSGSSQLTSSFDTRYLNTNGDGVISGSSQLTSSFDTRYILSGSSVSINTGSLATTGSNTFIGTETISGSLLLSGSFSYNGTPLQNGFAFAQPTLTRILDNVSYTGGSSWVGAYTGSGGAIIVTVNVSGFKPTTGLGTAQLYRDGVAVASQTFYFNIANYHTPLPPIVYTRNSETGSHTYSIYFSNISADTNDYATINVLEYGNSAILPATLISGSSQLTSSFDTRYTLSGSVGATPAGTISGSSQLTASYDSRYLTIDGDGVISGSSQLTSSFETVGRGIISSSAQLPSGLVSGSSQLPNGLVSGSSQLTASYDIRYALSGSGGSATIPAGTVSGSSQLTSSYDGRYTLTSSFNAFTASAQTVTTGSNSFNGTQIITGSLIITTGSFVGSQILANTSSLYLTSGSNLYMQNNGLVEITGSLNVRGTTRFETVGGDEGGEIEFGVPQTNTSLSTRVVADIYQNRLRIFDGNTNGVFIDLSKAPTGVAGEITWKASGFVNAGTFVQLDNIKVTIPTSGNRGASIGAVSTTFVANISGQFGYSGGVGGISANSVTYTTTASASAFGWNFGAEGDSATYILNDKTNSRVYRIIIMIGASYNNNFISIERLH